MPAVPAIPRECKSFRLGRDQFCGDCQGDDRDERLFERADRLPAVLGKAAAVPVDAGAFDEAIRR